MKKNVRRNKQDIPFWNRFSSSQKWLLLIVSGIIAASSLPIITLVLIGMLPTLTIILTDIKNSAKIMIVGSFNLSGVLIPLIDIFNAYSISGAIGIATNICNLIIMFGAAALGFIIYTELPNLFIFIAHSSSQKRLKKIDARIKQLTEEWGEEILKDQLAKDAK